MLLSRFARCRKGDFGLLKNLDAQALFDALPDVAIILDRLGRIRHFNPAAHRLFQYELDEIRGQPIEVLIPARFRIRHIAQRQNLLRGSLPEAWASNRKLMALRKDGTECHVLVSISTLTLARMEWVVCFVRDFTAFHDFERKAFELRHSFQGMAWILEAQGSLTQGQPIAPEALEAFHDHVASLSLNLPLHKAQPILVRDLIQLTRELVLPHIKRVAADLIVEEIRDEVWVHFSPALLQLSLLGFVKLCADAVAPLGERWVKIGLELQGAQLLISLSDSALTAVDARQQADELEFVVGTRLLECYGGRLLNAAACHSRFCMSVPVRNSPV
jgi:PAS domain S-box-containing protein